MTARTCVRCGASGPQVTLAKSSESGFKRHVCASAAGCRRRRYLRDEFHVGRQEGWREAIEALRDDDRFEAWACDLPADEYARYDKAVSVSFDAILAYLESLAPKETP